MAKIALVHSEQGDWIEVYVDGKSVYGGHSVRPEELLELANVSYESCEVSDDWCEINGFPEQFDDIPPGVKRQW